MFTEVEQYWYGKFSSVGQRTNTQLMGANLNNLVRDLNKIKKITLLANT